MKKTILYPILALFLAFFAMNIPSAISGDKGILFAEVSFEQALQMAQETNKPVFVGFYTNWCAACRSMRVRTYQNEEVSRVFNRAFINLHINGERGEGEYVASALEVEAYPTLVFLLPSGEIISRSTGFQSSEQLLELAGRVLALVEEKS
jgi:thioredoxin 1